MVCRTPCHTPSCFRGVKRCSLRPQIPSGPLGKRALYCGVRSESSPARSTSKVSPCQSRRRTSALTLQLNPIIGHIMPRPAMYMNNVHFETKHIKHMFLRPMPTGGNRLPCHHDNHACVMEFVAHLPNGPRQVARAIG